MQNQRLDKRTHELARQFIERASASLGNSEFYKGLKTAAFRPHKELTNILLFSDGHLNNLSAALTAIKNVSDLRVFCLACR